ncbi:MAG TPA: glycosyltransferase family 4 protein [Pyrinomonadaceae bacterium]
MVRQSQPIKILVIFGATSLYGMERAVIETFDLLRPEFSPLFLISRTPKRLGLPLFEEIQRRKFAYEYLSDHTGWPRLAKPSSFAQFRRMMAGVVRGNLDALRQIKKQDAIYLPNLFAAIYSILAILVCRLSRRRIIYHFHDIDPSNRILFTGLSLLITDYIHNTKTSQSRTVAKYKFVTRKANFIISCPIVNSRINSARTSLSEVSGGRKNILFVGQVSRPKGILLLLEAFDIIRKKHDDVFFHIVGGCENTEILERIRRRESESEPRLKFWDYQPTTSNFFREATIYVHPSLPSLFTESFGRGVVEAMAEGVPAVCFRSGALEELVVDQETGLICEEETPECLATALDRLIVDEGFRKRLGTQARERYENLYSSNKVKESWLAVFNEHAVAYN